MPSQAETGIWDSGLACCDSMFSPVPGASGAPDADGVRELTPVLWIESQLAADSALSISRAAPASSEARKSPLDSPDIFLASNCIMRHPCSISAINPPRIATPSMESSRRCSALSRRRLLFSLPLLQTAIPMATSDAKAVTAATSQSARTAYFWLIIQVGTGELTPADLLAETPHTPAAPASPAWRQTFVRF